MKLLLIHIVFATFFICESVLAVKPYSDDDFLVEFRKFWGKTIELATRTKNPDAYGEVFYDATENTNADPELNPSNIPAFAIDALTSHFVNANPNFIQVFVEGPQSYNRVLQAANLAQWTSILERRFGGQIVQIINMYWSNALTDFQKKMAQPYLNNGQSNTLVSRVFSILLRVPMSGNMLTYFTDYRKDPMLREKMIALILTIRHILKSPQLQITDFVNVRQVLLDPKIGLNIDDFPAAMKTLFEDGVIKYFDTIDLSILGRIISGILDLSPAESQNNNSIMLVALNRVGPAMQKLMQMFGNDAKSPELKQFLDKLKDSIEPMSDYERTLVVNRAFGGLNVWTTGMLPRWKDPITAGVMETSSVRFKLIELKQRVGAASIGEGWIATAKVHDDQELTREVFIKLMRWDVESKMQSEVDYLEGIKRDNPLLGNVLDELVAGLLEELDFKAEVANQLLGYQTYDSVVTKTDNGLYVPRPIGVFRSNGASSIVMPMETGKTLKKILSDNSLAPSHACYVVNRQKALIGTWINNLIAGKGMAHGDPHAGNILVGFHPNPKYTYMTILDWGNVIKIDKHTQDMLKQYATGIVAKDETTILTSLGRTASNKNDPRWLTLKKEIISIFKTSAEISANLQKSSPGYYEFTVDNSGESNLADREDDGNTFSLDSSRKQYEMINSGFDFGDRVLALIDNIVAKAVTNGLPIPPGTASILRARRFLEGTLNDLAKHPAVIRAKCKVPKPFSAFFSGLFSIKNVGLGLSAAPQVVQGALRNVYRSTKNIFGAKSSFPIQGPGASYPSMQSVPRASIDTVSDAESQSLDVDAVYPPKNRI